MSTPLRRLIRKHFPTASLPAIQAFEADVMRLRGPNARACVLDGLAAGDVFEYSDRARLMQGLGYAAGTINWALGKLQDAGNVRCLGGGQWQVVHTLA